jgi:hypothetical protein
MEASETARMLRINSKIVPKRRILATARLFVSTPDPHAALVVCP